MPDLILHGCRPEPLAHYLKALGLLRLVAEQADPHARGSWRGDTFVLRTTLSEADLVEFFLNHYTPTPILAPWNGGSGFYDTDQKSGIDAITASTSPRFSDYRRAIVECGRVLRDLDLSNKPAKDDKPRLVEHLRSELPDPALAWLDAALVLTDDGLDFPPLLGTGGNDGRLEFSNNHMQRLAELLLGAAPSPSTHLRAALFGEPAAGLLRDKAIGQFAPSHAGGANASAGFERGSLVNPWDYILMLEGAVLFAAAATRKLESTAPGTLAFPFTVRASASGYGSSAMSDETDTRDELWLPLWPHPATLAELRALFSEGRAKVQVSRPDQITSRPAATGIDFARAVTNLGVDRGLTGFVRYGFHVRNGLSYLATPLGRWRVPERPSEHVDLLAPLDRWLTDLRRRATGKTAPASLRRALRRLESAILDLCRRSAPRDVQTVLIALGDAEAALARARDHADMRPVPRLPALWLERASDPTPEFRLAAALASADLRPRLVPVDRVNWSSADHRRTVWTDADLIRNLHACLLRQHLEATQASRQDDDLDDQTCLLRHDLEDPGPAPPGIAAQAPPREPPSPFGRLHAPGRPRRFAALGDLAAFIAGHTDDRRLEALARGLSLLDWDAIPHRAPPPHHLPSPPTAFALLALALRWSPPGHPSPIKSTPGLLARACAGDLARATELASRRLRCHGLAVPDSHFLAEHPDRLAAALAFPLSAHAAGPLLALVLPRHHESAPDQVEPTS